MENFQKQIMTRVLDLAKKGLGYTRTNPLVGCVITKGRKIISEGYHQFFGGPHAEINALKKAKKNASGATIYVNLEPCNHFGKTPPCTQAIINSGIKKVVIAMKDPNPLVNGEGIKTLKQAGIKVEVGLLKNMAEEINAPYLKYIRTGLPYVIAKVAVSLDGKIATRRGDSCWISSAASRKYVYQLRSEMDGIIVGANTIIKDNPELSSHHYGNNPAKIVIDSKLKIPPEAKIFQKNQNIIFTADNPLNRRMSGKFKNSQFVFLPAKNSTLDFKDIMRELARKNFCRILIEGGGETIAQALKAKVIDEFIFFIAPKIIGGKDAPTAVEGNGIEKITDCLKLKFLKVARSGPDIFIRAKIIY